MKNLNSTQLKALSLVSLICIIIPSFILGLWFYVCACDAGATQPETVANFRGYFPAFLDSRWGTTLLSMIFCVLSIVLSGIGLKLPSKLWRVLNTTIIIISGLLLFMNLWSMM